MDVVAGVIAVLVTVVSGFSTLATALWACIVLGMIVARPSGYQLYTTSEAH